MKYSELRDEFNKDINEVCSVQDFYRAYLSRDIQSKLSSLKDKYVYHLFNDLSGLDNDKDFETFLGRLYRPANEFAKDCVETVLYAKHLHGLRIKGWSDSALKCFDSFLLTLIQDVLNEKIERRYGYGTEREKYMHLMDKGGNYYEIGIGFDTVYEQRNTLTHVEIIEDNGRRRQKPLSNKKKNKLKALILKNFERGLVALEKEIPS